MQTLEINNLNTNTLLTLLKDGEEVILLNDGQEFAKTVPYHNGNGVDNAITLPNKMTLWESIEQFREGVKETTELNEILEWLEREQKLGTPPEKFSLFDWADKTGENYNGQADITLEEILTWMGRR